MKVGVISDGVDSRAIAQATGDLPGTITIQTHLGSGDEGTAMLEIVHDLAPGAELGFCGPSTDVEMAQCVNDLASTFGADIIVDDLGFFFQAFFEDDFVAQAVAGVVSNGVFYTSAAGNDAETHYQGDYVDSGDGNQSHLISAGNTVFDIPASGNVRVFLQWTNRFDGTASDNYDLCLQSEDAATCAGLHVALQRVGLAHSHGGTRFAICPGARSGNLFAIEKYAHRAGRRIECPGHMLPALLIKHAVRGL